MLRKVIILLFLSSFLVSAYASNFYLGIGAGRNTGDFGTNIEVDDAPLHVDITFRDNKSATGYLGNLFGGYELTMGFFSLAAEMNANTSSLKNSRSITDATKNTDDETEYTINQSYGISLLPGYALTRFSKGFIRLGYVKSKFNVDDSLTLLPNNSILISETKWLDGFRYGIGIDTLVLRNTGVRLEYNHISYQNTDTFGQLGSSFTSSTIDPQADEVLLSLYFNFC